MNKEFFKLIENVQEVVCTRCDVFLSSDPWEITFKLYEDKFYKVLFNDLNEAEKMAGEQYFSVLKCYCYGDTKYKDVHGKWIDCQYDEVCHLRMREYGYLT